MGSSSFFSDPTDYTVVDEGGDGSGFYDGPAYTAIDPVAINDSVAEAAASATASEASKVASGVSATASAASASASATSAAAALVSQNAAAASATAADASDDNAVAQAAIATTKASEAATSAAAALVSEGNADTSETNAASSASAASTSASNASTSASNASTSETNAAASAAAALVSETNAAAAVQAAKGTATPLMDGSADVGTGVKWAKEDHVHPTDTSRADAAATTSALALKAPLASPTFTGTPAAPTATVGTNTTQLATTAFVIANLPAGSVLPGYLTGLGLSTAGSSATFGIAAGLAADSSAAGYMTLASAYTKTTSAWAVGSGNGALDTGSIATSTWYHAHLIKRVDTGVVDVLVSLSATAPTLPANYTLSRRIGSMKTNGSSQWTKFFQVEDVFYWDLPVSDVGVANPGTTAVTRTLTVPTGVKVLAKLFVAGSGLSGDPGPGAIYVSDLAVTDSAALLAPFSSVNVYVPNSGALIGQLGAQVTVFTNTSAQVRTRVQLSNANIRLDINTLGWTDTRGK